MKKCTNCQEEKTIDQFEKNRWYSDGYNGRCNTCIEEYDKSLEDKKYCTKCDEVKDKSEFFKRKASSDGCYYKCKACYKKDSKGYSKQYYSNNKQERNKYVKKYCETLKNGYYNVYLLPKENYVGSTISIPIRIIHHKNQGRDITDYKVLAKFKTHEEALHYESEIHLQGYNGGLSNNEKTKLKKYLQCQNIQTKKNKRSLINI